MSYSCLATPASLPPETFNRYVWMHPVDCNTVADRNISRYNNTRYHSSFQFYPGSFCKLDFDIADVNELDAATFHITMESRIQYSEALFQQALFHHIMAYRSSPLNTTIQVEKASNAD